MSPRKGLGRRWRTPSSAGSPSWRLPAGYCLTGAEGDADAEEGEGGGGESCGAQAGDEVGAGGGVDTRVGDGDQDGEADGGADLLNG
ncbi:hypothetical protein ACIQZB_28495 [Streptomyces sp. NPDC097727]|uniref:hypothetical protein n=1 Tax=Streptomyces sp. NPDC097727 TaxID=3366092 RepID=UPI003818AF31